MILLYGVITSYSLNRWVALSRYTMAAICQRTRTGWRAIDSVTLESKGRQSTSSFRREAPLVRKRPVIPS